MGDGASSVILPPRALPGGRFDALRPGRISYVVCDVDGTLVGPEQLASPEVVDAVRRTQEAGVRVGFATGRMRDAVTPLEEQVGALGPHVHHNGAEVHADGRTVASWTLSEDQVDALLAIADEHEHAYVEIYTESGFLASKWDERARPHWGILDTEPRGLIRRAAELDGAPVLKATFAVFDVAHTSPLERRIRELGLAVGTAGSPRAPGMTFVNVTHPDTDKGHAVRQAARYLELELSQVAAVGDAANDLSMLEVVGTAIAMGQSPDEVRAVSHLVVPDVDAHGVAVALDTVVGWLVD